MGHGRHGKGSARAVLKWATLLAVGAAGVSARAEVPDNLEPDYAEAVLAFNARDYAKTLERLNSLLKDHPEVNEFLELKALSLRATQNDADAAQIYRQLVANKTREGRPPAELAPYHFELAMILTRQKKPEEAKPSFEFSIANGFNVAPSHLYTGLGAFNAGRWAEAEGHFQGVLSEKLRDLKPVAHFYLGQTYMRLEYPAGATASLVEARRASRSLLDDADTDPETRKVAQQIFDATEASLAPYDKGQFFGYVGTLSGYDSNVLYVPSTGSSAAYTTGKASMKQTLMVGGGYASSSMRALQFVPSLKSNIGYNFNKDSQGYQFATTVASFYVTRNPVAPFSFGVKVDASIVFKNDVDADTGKGVYRPYSRSASLGPYFRYQVSRGLQLSLEMTGEPKKYLDDPYTTQRRSGSGYAVRGYLASDSGSRFWNPTGSFRYAKDNAEGTEYLSSTVGADLMDVVHWSDKVDLTATASFYRQAFPLHSVSERRDVNLAVQLGASWKWKPRWTVLGNLGFTRNNSNFETVYSYNKAEFGGGITYSF